jgi:hypothetical protein
MRRKASQSSLTRLRNNSKTCSGAQRPVHELSNLNANLGRLIASVEDHALLAAHPVQADHWHRPKCIFAAVTSSVSGAKVVGCMSKSPTPRIHFPVLRRMDKGDFHSNCHALVSSKSVMQRKESVLLEWGVESEEGLPLVELYLHWNTYDRTTCARSKRKKPLLAPRARDLDEEPCAAKPASQHAVPGFLGLAKVVLLDAKTCQGAVLDIRNGQERSRAEVGGLGRRGHDALKRGWCFFTLGL